MVALSREDAATLLARRKPGPPGRDDVHRPVVCPEGHIGANIRFDRMGGTDPQYARANYRCARLVSLDDGAKVEVRHRFVLRGGDDPLPRRHPLFQRPDTLDPEAVHWHDGECNHCERVFASDDGLRAGRAFYFAIIEIARFLVGVSTGLTVTAAIKEMRHDAGRVGKRTRSHRRKREAMGEDDIAALVAARDAARAAGWEEVFEGEPGDDDPGPTGTTDEWPTVLPPLIGNPRSTRVAFAVDEVEAAPLVDFEALPRDRPAPADPDWVSRSFALGGQYIDVFADAITGGERVNERPWPRAIAVDTLPLNRRGDPTTATEREIARTQRDFLCEIVAIVDVTPGSPRDLIALYPMGGRDTESLKAVLAARAGTPEWVVSDGDPAIALAVKETWGDRTIHYRCEEHLADDAREAATADNVLGPDLDAAIGRCQRDRWTWRALRRLVDSRHPGEAQRLRAWMDGNEDLVHVQMAYRDVMPDMDRSSGSVEAHLLFVRHAFEHRRLTLANRRRLVKVLDLMRLYRNGDARIEHYAAAIRGELERVRREHVEWRGHWDRMITDVRGRPVHRRNTLLEFRDRALVTAAIARRQRTILGQKGRDAEVAQRAQAAAIAAGGTGMPGPARRGATRERLVLTGRKVAEIPDQMRYWDRERNTVDPSRVAAGSNKPRFWVCHGHEAGDPLGRWPGHAHRWEQPPQQRFFVGQGCKFCMQREACPATCLATTHPHLVAEWDLAANDAAGNGLTPENVTPGSDREALWACPAHGIYRRKVNERTALGFGCPIEEQEKGQRERREKVNAKRREDRARALSGLAARLGTVDRP